MQAVESGVLSFEATAWLNKVRFKASQRACLKSCNPQLADGRRVRRSSLYVDRDEVFV
jgi:hypothetical protein